MVIIDNIWFYSMENQRGVPNTHRIVNSYGDRNSNKPDFIIAHYMCINYLIIHISKYTPYFMDMYNYYMATKHEVYKAGSTATSTH